MIVMSRRVRGVGMEGGEGFEMLKIALVHTSLHSWGWDFCLQHRDILQASLVSVLHV